MYKIKFLILYTQGVFKKRFCHIKTCFIHMPEYITLHILLLSAGVKHAQLRQRRNISAVPCATVNLNNNARKNGGRRLNIPGVSGYSTPSTKAICINFVTVVVSTIGLIFLVLGYCCLGGAVFEWLESNTEKETIVNNRRHVEALVKQHAANLYKQLQVVDESVDTITVITDILNNISRDAYSTAKNSQWDGEGQGASISLDWTFPGAILFSATTITTIGALVLSSSCIYASLININGSTSELWLIHTFKLVGNF